MATIDHAHESLLRQGRCLTHSRVVWQVGIVLVLLSAFDGEMNLFQVGHFSIQSRHTNVSNDTSKIDVSEQVKQKIEINIWRV